MSIDFVTRNWSLVLASVLLTGIALFVLFRVYVDSAKGQLGARVRALRTRYNEAESARRAVVRAEKRLEQLGAKSARVKPRHIEEARDALEDARSLLKIAGDQVLIAENHVRKIIVEEFPPKRQEALRNRFLHSPEGREKPFTF